MTSRTNFSQTLFLMAVPKPRTDLGELYYEAELQYTTITGQPFGISLVQHIDDVKNVAQQAASQFDQKRHDGRLGDRLRTLVGNNIGTIQKVVNHFAGAATAGFPPCAPVFTAFNCVVGACVAVKADYDLLDTFFSDVGRQLNLIGVLEGNLNRINVQEPFASIKDVFIMVIRVCAFAVAYIKEKRLFHSAKSLVLGKDDKLAGAYSELGAACKRLSDIVGVATLAMTARIDTRVEDGFRNMTNTMNSLIEKTGGTLPKLKALFKDAPDFSAAQQIRKPLEGTTTWLFEDEIYKEWETKEKPILWLHGLPGTGKTYLACSILERLKLRSRRLRRSPCGWFFFSNTREDTRSMVNALVGAVLQIAQEDEVYARQVLASLENQERDWFHAPLSEVWDVFFKDRFTTQRSEQSEVEVALVFDGFENVLDDERREFLRLCAQIKEQGLAIRLLLVGASDLEQDLTALGEDTISTILIDNSKNRQDVELFVDDQMKGLTRQFERETLTTIASRLKEKGEFRFHLAEEPSRARVAPTTC